MAHNALPGSTASAGLTATGLAINPQAVSAADYGPHLAVSLDGLNWSPLNQVTS
ncbi:hypothetical protein [Micromonospora sp. DT229]|uniref:hypothetical protein n=1 Tax=Micromonospora sp. DT229 TaxID=3393430 RepID=UPI003CF2BE85